jgi:exonuclease III
MAFRKKAALIMAARPDILVVPECEHPKKIDFGDGSLKPTDALWFGQNHHKGLGIFSYGDFHLRKKRSHTEDLKHIVPVTVSNKGLTINLFAIWANSPDDPDGQYVEQVWKAIHHYKNIIRRKQTILIGDFNSNTIWDRPRRIGNHSAVVKKLNRKGIRSVYHSYFGQTHGKEEHSTFYLYKHRDKPYHIDYCFASEDLMTKLTSVEVGAFDNWKVYSDHMPLIASFELD